MVNEFLLPVSVNGQHSNNCFCFPCRQRRVHRTFNDSIDDLERAFLSDSQEYRRLNILFEETKNKIIRGETFRQKCLQNTHYTSFGWWMRTEPRYAGLTDSEKKHMRQKVRIVHSVYMHWERIVTNLTDARLQYVDARRLSIDQLHEAININWCFNQDELLRSPGEIPEELLYSEDKYRTLINFIDQLGILDDMNHDRKECSRFTRRLQRDLGKICSCVNK